MKKALKWGAVVVGVVVALFAGAMIHDLRARAERCEDTLEGALKLQRLGAVQEAAQ